MFKLHKKAMDIRCSDRLDPFALIFARYTQPQTWSSSDIYIYIYNYIYIYIYIYINVIHICIIASAAECCWQFTSCFCTRRGFFFQDRQFSQTIVH